MMMKWKNIDSPSRPCCQDFAIGCQGVPICCPFAFPVCEGDQSLLKDRQKKSSSQMDFCRKNLWEFRTSWQQKQYLNKEMVIRWNLVSNFGNSFNWKIKHLLTLIFRRNAGKKMTADIKMTADLKKSLNVVTSSTMQYQSTLKSKI